MIPLNTIHCMDCLIGMKEIPDKTVDLTVTSPPYDNLREYKGYTFNFEDTAKEIYRVTKNGGVVVWVVGDATINGSETGTSFKQALYFKEIGFNLHDTMIYHKNGASYPSGKTSTRYSQVFEYMFVLCKSEIKTHNLLKDKRNKWKGCGSFGQGSSRTVEGDLEPRKDYTIGTFGYRDNIWKINNGKGYGGDDSFISHPASFPEQLANDHILSWSNKGDLVLDPFMGSGTTGKMAIINEREFIGFEIAEEYFKIAETRINNAKAQGKISGWFE